MIRLRVFTFLTTSIMTIIQEANFFLKSIKYLIPTKVRGLFSFGFKTLSIFYIKSLNSNARSVIENIFSAKSKIYRLCKNKNVLKIFPFLIKNILKWKNNILINIDFSDFKGYMVLMLAMQTKRGRALPLFFDILTYPIKTGSQNLFIIQTIKSFLKLISKNVSLVFDRGFACPSIIEYLVRRKIIFFIRIKSCKLVENTKGVNQKVKTFSAGKHKVKAYGYNLYLVVSPNKENTKEPWYIITNDPNKTAEEICGIYYHRFEIEEFFKDAKHLYGLEKIKVKTIKTLKMVLWFVILGFWFLNGLKNFVKNWLKLKIKDVSYYLYCFEKINFILRNTFLSSISP